MIQDILISLKNSKGFLAGKLLICASFFFILLHTSTYINSILFQYNKLDKHIQNDSNFDFYKIADNYIDEEETLLFQNPGSLSMLKYMYQLLNTEEKFEFYDITYQPFYFDKFIGSDVFDVEYGIFDTDENEKTAIGGYMLTNKTLAFNEFSTVGGLKGFPGEAFNGTLPVSNSTIPVFLGSDFMKYFQIGDIIPVNFMWVDLNLEVLDFIPVDEYLVIGNSIVNLNKIILSPSQIFNQLPSDIESKTYLMFNYLMKNNGYIYTNNLSANDLQILIQSLGEKAGVNKYFVLGATNSSVKTMGITLLEITKMLCFVAIGLFLFSILTIVILTISQIRKKQYVYAVQILCGSSLQQIKWTICIEIAITSILSLLLGLFVFVIRYGLHLNDILTVLMAFGLLTIISCIFTVREIDKINLLHVIKGE